MVVNSHRPLSRQKNYCYGPTCFGISIREEAASWVKVCSVTMTMGVEG